MNEMDKTRLYEEDDVIDIGRLCVEVLEYWWIVVLSTLIVGAFALGYCVLMKNPLYQSTTGIYVMSYNEKNDTMSYSDTQLAAQMTKDYAQLIVSRTVLETVIDDLSLKMTPGSLKSTISVENVKDTRILHISVKNEDPELAREIADRIRVVAIEQIQKVTKGSMVTTVDEADLPKKPVEPSKKKWLMIGLFAGFALSVGCLVARSILDDTIKSSEDVERQLGWSTLALIPMIELEDRSEAIKKKGSAKKAVKTRSHSETDKQ